jgi:hypothetical protein
VPSEIQLCLTNLFALSVTPASYTTIPGNAEQYTATATYQNCNGSNIYSDATAGSSWSSNDTAVAILDSTTRGLVHAVGGGSAQITAVYNGFTHQPTCQPPPCHTPCQNYPQQVASSTTCNVQVPYFVSLVKSKTTSTCSGQSCLREVWYQVLDANLNPIYLAGMQIAETVSGTHTGNCTGSLQDYGTWTTDATGTMTGPDYWWWCCAPTGRGSSLPLTLGA